ncbi:hypothetical protein [Vibrio alginolyticus]|uniref:hypothetical protein n=1 Tax=Vibrio alginolyticus TaxID=663 RepID=UPI0006CAA5D8|nr:hypothetical protein [Vibrio alginolyticus]KPM98725.1 hypothetical protein AOG25_10010 [Vibrio alginolyticus]
MARAQIVCDYSIEKSKVIAILKVEDQTNPVWVGDFKATNPDLAKIELNSLVQRLLSYCKNNSLQASIAIPAHSLEMLNKEFNTFIENNEKNRDELLSEMWQHFGIAEHQMTQEQYFSNPDSKLFGKSFISVVIEHEPNEEKALFSLVYTTNNKARVFWHRTEDAIDIIKDVAERSKNLLSFVKEKYPRIPARLVVEPQTYMNALEVEHKSNLTKPKQSDYYIINANRAASSVDLPMLGKNDYGKLLSKTMNNILEAGYGNQLEFYVVRSGEAYALGMQGRKTDRDIEPRRLTPFMSKEDLANNFLNIKKKMFYADVQGLKTFKGRISAPDIPSIRSELIGKHWDVIPANYKPFEECVVNLQEKFPAYTSDETIVSIANHYSTSRMACSSVTFESELGNVETDVVELRRGRAPFKHSVDFSVLSKALESLSSLEAGSKGIRLLTNNHIADNVLESINEAVLNPSEDSLNKRHTAKNWLKWYHKASSERQSVLKASNYFVRAKHGSKNARKNFNRTDEKLKTLLESLYSEIKKLGGIEVGFPNNLTQRLTMESIQDIHLGKTACIAISGQSASVSIEQIVNSESEPLANVVDTPQQTQKLDEKTARVNKMSLR